MERLQKTHILFAQVGRAYMHMKRMQTDVQYTQAQHQPACQSECGSSEQDTHAYDMGTAYLSRFPQKLTQYKHTDKSYIKYIYGIHRLVHSK